MRQYSFELYGIIVKTVNVSVRFVVSASVYVYIASHINITALLGGYMIILSKFVPSIGSTTVKEKAENIISSGMPIKEFKQKRKRMNKSIAE